MAFITFILHFTLLSGTQWRAYATEENKMVHSGNNSKPVQKNDIGIGYISMNSRDVDIHILIKFINELTGKDFLLDPVVRGNVTILSPQKESLQEAYRVFLSVPQVHGFTTVPAVDVTNIIKYVDAMARGIETLYQKAVQRPSDKIITQLVPLRHGAATVFAKLISPIIPESTLMIPCPDTNTLIIMDKAFNLERLLMIIRELDGPRPLVYVEALIMEVSANKALDLGWSGERVMNTGEDWLKPKRHGAKPRLPVSVECPGWGGPSSRLSTKTTRRI